MVGFAPPLQPGPTCTDASVLHPPGLLLLLPCSSLNAASEASLSQRCSTRANRPTSSGIPSGLGGLTTMGSDQDSGREPVQYMVRGFGRNNQIPATSLRGRLVRRWPRWPLLWPSTRRRLPSCLFLVEDAG